MSCARTRTSVGPPRWTWQSTCSTACWSSDARSTSASPNPKPGWGQCAHSPDPCNTAPVDGDYRIVIANNLPAGQTTNDVQVDEIGLGTTYPRPGRTSVGQTIFDGIRRRSYVAAQ